MAQNTDTPRPAVHKIPASKLRDNKARTEKDSRLWDKHIKQQGQKSK